ncbi:MAG: hypothetical protein PHQ28_04745 [Mycobacterium sp.]|nr:hypothetical protein [Mycobacterium sp.]
MAHSRKNNEAGGTLRRNSFVLAASLAGLAAGAVIAGGGIAGADTSQPVPSARFADGGQPPPGPPGADDPSPPPGSPAPGQPGVPGAPAAPAPPGQ